MRVNSRDNLGRIRYFISELSVWSTSNSSSSQTIINFKNAIKNLKKFNK